MANVPHNIVIVTGTMFAVIFHGHPWLEKTSKMCFCIFIAAKQAKPWKRKWTGVFSFDHLIQLDGHVKHHFVLLSPPLYGFS